MVLDALTKKLASRLRQNGMLISDISNKLRISRHILWSYLRPKELGFKSDYDYRQYLAKKRGFKSSYDYRQNIEKRRFRSSYDYRQYLAKKRGFKSHYEYVKYRSKQKGFKSHNEYEHQLAKKRQQRPENQRLSYLIRKGLKELKQNKTWLAKKLGVSLTLVIYYTRGSSIPKKDKLKKLYSVFNIPYKTLDDHLK